MCDSIADGGKRCPAHSGTGRYFADLARRVYGTSNPETRALVEKHAVQNGALSKLRGERGALAARTSSREEMEILLKDTSYQVRWALATNDDFRKHQDLVSALKSNEKRREVLDALAGGADKPVVASQTRVWRTASEPEAPAEPPAGAYAEFLKEHGTSDTWTAADLDAMVETAKKDPAFLDSFTPDDHVAAMSRYSPRRVDELLMQHQGTSPRLLAAAWVRSKHPSTHHLVIKYADVFGLAHLVQSEDRELQALVAQKMFAQGHIRSDVVIEDLDSPQTIEAIEKAREFALLLQGIRPRV